VRRVRLPAAPLVAEVRRRSVILPRCSAEARAYQRANERGWITEQAADDFAVRVLRMHPAELWPDWFDRFEVAS
jgi:hypothetical protein